MTLPDNFKPGNDWSAPGGLPATRGDLHLPTANATAEVYRAWHN